MNNTVSVRVYYKKKATLGFSGRKVFYISNLVLIHHWMAWRSLSPRTTTGLLYSLKNIKTVAGRAGSWNWEPVIGILSLVPWLSLGTFKSGDYGLVTVTASNHVSLCHWLPLKSAIEGASSSLFYPNLIGGLLTGRTCFTFQILTIRKTLGYVVFLFCFVLAFLSLKYRKACIGSGGKEQMPSATWLI